MRDIPRQVMEAVTPLERSGPSKAFLHVMKL